MYGNKSKGWYEVWFGFSEEMSRAVGAAMDGSTYDFRRRSEYRQYGEYAHWAETRPIKWRIRLSDSWDGCWVLEVTAQAAMPEAERRAIRAVHERLSPGTRVRLVRPLHGRLPLPQGTEGTVTAVDWQNGVSVAFLDTTYTSPDTITVDLTHDIGKYWVVPVDDTEYPCGHHKSEGPVKDRGTSGPYGSQRVGWRCVDCGHVEYTCYDTVPAIRITTKEAARA
jgi:hypothetical protein